MVFSSLTFLFAFLPIVILLYFTATNITLKNLVLFIASIIFYAWGEPVYIVLMLISTVSDYLHALLITFFKTKGYHIWAKVALISAIVINLGLLGFFKYSDFVIMNINNLFNTNLSLLHLPLPIGISFYTFQTMSYTIDVFFGRVKVQKSLLALGTYVALFPQLIAGPIVRYETIQNELIARKDTWGDVGEGIRRFIIGLSKKIIIANQMAIIANAVFEIDKNNLGVSLAWVGIIAYTLQIYFDFSGYSDMAIGLGRVFGFKFLENFNYPYISQSITDFWRRWHISLSSWFRDYVYIPLGGNRVGNARWLFNILIVWFLTGLWHGADWNFVVWGLYFGVIIVLEKFVLLHVLEKLPRVLRHFYAILLFIIGWVIFRTGSLNDLKSYLFALFGGNGNNSLGEFSDLSILHLLPFMLFAIIGSTPLIQIVFKKAKEKFLTSIVYDALLTAMFLICIMYLVNSSFNPFIYYRF